ncbi:MAG: hypothetical protein K0R15_1800 [Clostridiales bacterium]|jgi:adenylate kinase family enzyme|nr:hypothetical protein [Clostridiales bacterium]
MIILIAGCSHTGKTLMSQKLLEKYKYPYLSIDHLKMGLIRSGNTDLTPDDSTELEAYLWPIIREIIKTAIENQQNLVIEGCYVPFDWKNSFEEQYLEQIKYYCLIMTEEYINNCYADIKAFANVIEQRIDDSYCTKEMLLKDNAFNLKMCKKYGCNYILIDDDYEVDIKL